MDNNLDKTPGSPRPVPRRPSYRAPIILGAAVLTVAIAGLLISTPQPISDSTMPAATENAVTIGTTDLMTAPAVAPAADNTITTTPTDQINTGVTPPAPIYASQVECEAVNPGRSCVFQSCTQTATQSCPTGFREGWQAAFAAPDNTTMPDTIAPPAATPPSNAAITPQAAPAEINPPAESGGTAPRNDGVTGTEDPNNYVLPPNATPADPAPIQE